MSDKLLASEDLSTSKENSKVFSFNGETPSNQALMRSSKN